MSETEFGYIPEKNRQKETIHLREWFSVIGHTHSKVADLFSQGEVMQNWQDGQLTLKKLAETLTALNKKGQGLFFVDSDHAAHSLDEYHPGLESYKKAGISEAEVSARKKELLTPDKIDSTVEMISERIDQRRQAVEQFRLENPELGKGIFTGIEVDVLNSDGLLDVNNETLSKHECVGASYHVGEWKDLNQDQEPNLPEITKAYQTVINNEVVDILNHFIRELPPSVLDEIKADPTCFDELFEDIAGSGKALEISLRDLVNPNKQELNKLSLALYKRAKEKGVKFILGTDFHRLEQYLPEKLADGKPQQVDEQSKAVLRELANREVFLHSEDDTDAFEKEINIAIQTAFTPKQGAFGLPKNFTNLFRPIHKSIRQLQEIGITPEDILNGDKKRFGAWVEKRKADKQ